MAPDEDRFDRQVRLPEVGPEGQRRIAAARVAIVGMGGLGCPAAQVLAAAGVGHLTLIDPDTVETSNLHRQILYTPQDVGMPKVAAAAARLQGMVPGLTITTHQVALGAPDAASLLAGHTLVVDGTDRLATRYAIDAACRQARIPWVHGAVSRFEGQTATFAPPGPWYADLWPQPPARAPGSCAEEGILPSVTAIVGAAQAHEALLELLAVPRQRSLQVHHFIDGGTDTVHLARTGPSLRRGAQAVLDPHTTVLDVRSREEFEAGSLGRALHVPLETLQERPEAWKEKGPLLLVCTTGHRSTRAAMLLRRHGVDASSLDGGLESWRRSGGAVHPAKASRVLSRPAEGAKG